MQSYSMKGGEGTFSEILIGVQLMHTGSPPHTPRKKGNKKQSEDPQQRQIYGFISCIKLLNIQGELKTYHDLQIQKGC